MEPEPKGGTTKYVVGIVVIALIIVGVSIMGSKQPKNSPSQTTSETATTDTAENTQDSATASPATTTVTFTMTDVATHNNEDSCYTAVSGSVYDVTLWIYKHPGGAAKILAICGKDGTSAFEGKHGGQPKQEETLASFKIGELTK